MAAEGEQGLGEMLVNHMEYVGKRLSTNSGIPGRLKKLQFVEFYEGTLKAYAEMVAMVRHGYVISFKSVPPYSSDTNNNASCLWQADFAFAEMIWLKALCCVREVSRPSRVELSLSVIFSNKMRLVVDASRHLNTYMKKEKTRLESLDSLTCIVEKGESCSVDDFDSGYWHVPLHKSMYKQGYIFFLD